MHAFRLHRCKSQCLRTGWTEVAHAGSSRHASNAVWQVLCNVGVIWEWCSWLFKWSEEQSFWLKSFWLELYAIFSVTSVQRVGLARALIRSFELTWKCMRMISVCASGLRSAAPEIIWTKHRVGASEESIYVQKPEGRLQSTGIYGYIWRAATRGAPRQYTRWTKSNLCMYIKSLEWSRVLKRRMGALWVVGAVFFVGSLFFFARNDITGRARSLEAHSNDWAQSLCIHFAGWACSHAQCLQYKFRFHIKYTDIYANTYSTSLTTNRNYTRMNIYALGTHRVSIRDVCVCVCVSLQVRKLGGGTL